MVANVREEADQAADDVQNTDESLKKFRETVHPS